jgi:hypothetical protein
VTPEESQKLANIEADIAASVAIRLARQPIDDEAMELWIRRQKRTASIDSFLGSVQLRYSGAFAVAVLSLTLAAAWANLLPSDFVGLVHAVKGLECPPGVPPALIPVQPVPGTDAPVPVPM